MLQALQVVHLDRPPQGQYPLQVTVPLPADFSGPICISQGGVLKPTESQVISRTRRFQVRELVAEVEPAASYDVVEGSCLPEARPAESDALRLALNYGAVVLHVSDENGTRSFSLTGRPNVTGFQGFHRQGRLMLTSEHHRALGRFGWLLYSMTIRKGIEQIDFCLDWHACLPGPDRWFTKAWITVAPGMRCSPYGQDLEWLGVQSTYSIPQMRHRPMRFSVVAANGVVQREYVGKADWSQGGFLTAGFPVPPIPNVSYAARLALEKSELPHGRMWIPKGGPYGGWTGGDQMWPNYGVEWAASGDADALEYYRLEQLRNACRDTCLVGRDGKAIRHAEYLQSGAAPWRMFDEFERVGGVLMDQPWGFSRWEPVLGAEHDPRAYADIDLQHDVRDQNEDLVLYYMAHDWLAKHQLLRAAANARMVWWEGVGVASRLGLPAAQGIGTHVMGRDEAWGGQAVGVGKAIAPDSHAYDHWAWTYVEHCRRAQMDSGLIQATAEFKEAGQFPFGLDQYRPYLIHASNEACYNTLTLWMLGETFDLDVEPILRQHARGFLNLAGNPGGTGVWSYVAVGPNNGTNVRYVTRNDWPTALANSMGDGIVWNDALHMGYTIAAMKLAGATQADELLLRFTRTETIQQAIAEMRRWTTLPHANAPSLQTGAPPDQYAPALGVYTAAP